MSIHLDRKRLAQEKSLEWLLRDMKPAEMITVHRWVKNSSHEYAIYCALIPSYKIEGALSDPADWDLHFYQGTPSAVDVGQFQYLRYGNDSQIEPLVINREFNESQINYGKRTEYSEISEEFRLFHNLYHDKEKDKYIKIDDEGNEHRVIVVEPNHIQIRLKELRQFLAIKEMYLSIQFRYYEFSKYSLGALGASEDKIKKRRETTTDGEICWEHSYYAEIHESEQAFSVLEGKRLIEPLPKSKSGFPGFAEEPKKKHVKFIVGIDENEEKIYHTCNPTKLNRYGNNPGAIYDITPVHFHKQVLDKYYGDGKYSVEDSRVSCPWWGMRIDNHHDAKVIVWLRELSSLPYKEQLHWQSHNIPPEGGVSPTFWRRNFKGEWANSDQPEHLFKQRYEHLGKESEKYLGWQLLRPLDPRDEHHLKGLRVPSTDEQRDFDALVLSLTKILIDSLNQKELKKLISLEQEENLTPDLQERLKGNIGCLEIALNSCGVEGAADHIAFLRKLQSLRSTGSAHRKGSNYQKIAKAFGIESKDLRAVFAGILSNALDVLDYFIFLIRSRQINREIIKRNERERGYAIFSQMIGFLESDSTDGSVNHDEVIYELDSKP